MTHAVDYVTDQEREAIAWAARLADGDLTVEEQMELQAWLDLDPENGVMMERVVAGWQPVEHYATHPDIVALRAAALDAARRSHRRRQTRSVLDRHWRWMLAAASVVVTLTGGATWLSTVPQTYVTAVGERRIVVLPDGSKMSLDGATKLRVRYAGNSRKLWLDGGRARFDVAKDSLRPFSVTSAGRVVVATGTSFSVERLREQVRVVLYEGRVSVLSEGSSGRPGAKSDGRAAKPTITLAPGNQLVALASDASVQPTVVAHADTVQSLSWEVGQLDFDREPLSLAIERVNRYAPTPLVVADNSTAAVRISGVFNTGDTQAFLQGISVAYAIRHRANGAQIVLYRQHPPSPVEIQSDTPLAPLTDGERSAR